MTKEIDWRFKFLYVIAILSVVFGHVNYNGGISFFYDWFPIGTIHLAIFIFSSGYFYNERNMLNITAFCIRKVKQLIIPLYSWNLFYGIFVSITKKIGFTIGDSFTLYSLLIKPIYNGHQYWYNLGGWFIIPLFMVQVFFVLYRKLLQLLHLKFNDWILFSFELFLGVLGVYISKCGYNTDWWLVLTRFLTFIPFYGLGILYNRKLEKIDMIPNILYFAILFIIQLILLTYYNNRIEYSLVSSTFKEYNYYIPYIVGTTGILFWLRISRILLPVITNNKIIRIISDNTYSIMINQFLGFMLVKTIYAVISKYTSLCRGFDMNQYKSDVYYFYIPYGNDHWYLIYSIAGIAIPIIMQLGLNKLKKLKNRNNR